MGLCTKRAKDGSVGLEDPCDAAAEGHAGLLAAGAPREACGLGRGADATFEDVALGDVRYFWELNINAADGVEGCVRREAMLC